MECTHVFLDVVHTPESIRTMYESYDGSATDTYFQGIDQQATANFDSYLNSCRQYLRTTSQPPRLLDVGCGSGALLERAKAAGFACEGIETCQPLAEKVLRRLGCVVHNALMSQVRIPDNTFDVVTMYDLVEHLQAPVQDLGEVRRWLKPGGILFALTPNDDALIRRLAKIAFRGSFGYVRRPLKALYYSHHLSYFTARSMQKLLQQLQLELVHMETRNQEIARLILSPMERIGVEVIFKLTARMPSAGGKLIVWARKPE